ncbi:MAG: taurine ABC transporter substrate-binding protein, partial [bacterium]
MEKTVLKIAFERYDRHVPFFAGLVTPPDGVEIEALEVGHTEKTSGYTESYPRRDGVDRHIRMLHDREFDICELSLSFYLIAKSGDFPFTAVPVFPRRLFSQSLFFVNAASGIETPGDLVGKKVAIHGFQVTLAVLGKGDLKFEYGVPWEEIHWYTMNPPPVPLQLKEGISVTDIPPGKDPGEML